jgi:hypothetical protein
MPWRRELEPRLACTLAARLHDPHGRFGMAEVGEEELGTVLRQAKSEVQRLLNERLIYSDAVIKGHVDYEDELARGDDERNLELRFGITLFEV